MKLASETLKHIETLPWSADSYMKVEDVLRYLKLNIIGATQYKLDGYENNFFKCSDIKKKIGERLFRVMECDVVTYITKF